MAVASSSHIETSVGQEANAEIHSKTFILVLAVNCVYFAQVVNLVGTGAYARDIAAVVGGAGDTVWLTSVLTILTVVLSPPISQAADYWGRKWFLVVLTAMGFVGCIIVSRSSSMGVVIAGLTISGMSYGAQPLIHAVTSEVLPRKYRSYGQASNNVAIALGAVFALYIGGTLTRNSNHEGFRTFWYIVAGIYAVCTAIVGFLYNPPLRELQIKLDFKEKISRLDWVGYVLLTAGLVLLCLGLSWYQNPYPFTDVHVLATFVTGVSLSLILVVHQWRFKRDGMFHRRLFQDSNFPLAVLCVFCEGLSFFCSNNYFAFEISVFYTADPLQIGLHYSIAFHGFLAFALVAGAYCWKTKTVRLPTTFAFLCFLIFNVLMATTGPNTPVANIWAYPVFLGVGLGLALTTLMLAAQFATPPDLIAITSGLMISVRSLGGTVGLAIYNTIFNGVLANNLAPRIAAATLPLGLPEASLDPFITALTAKNLTAMDDIRGVSPEIIGAGALALQEAFAVGFRYVWVASGAFALLAMVSSIFMTDPRADFNAHIDAPAEVDRITQWTEGSPGLESKV